MSVTDIRASQIFGIFGHTVFCVLLNERKLMRPSLGRLEVIFDGCQASKANQSRLTFFKNHPLDWSALEAWQPSKMTSNLPKLGLISFLSLSRTQKTVCPKIPKNWDALVTIFDFETFCNLRSSAVFLRAHGSVDLSSRLFVLRILWLQTASHS